ncbi:MAG TPA: hypothetical protein VE422_50260 [Terriglobia bacterium]|nr:hypothetical protein [Terriglobia bacterium]
MTKPRTRLTVVVALCFFFGIAWSAEELPNRLSDEAFWKLITDFSEPGGRFVSDNFVSNELGTQQVLSKLTQGRIAEGAYLGVGPEQNFTYIVALKPKISFIVDIRRQNMIEHLMYKALIEISADRAEFLSRLFSRARPADLNQDSSVVALFDAFRDIEADPNMFQESLGAIKDRLTTGHGFRLSMEDEGSLDYVFRAFYVGGPNLGYPGPNQAIRRGVVRILPTYEELMLDTDEQDQIRSYLATEENFLTLQQLEKNNLIVPLVGNFAGPTAIRSVGQYLKDHGATVTAFYTSNVEQYLFMSPDDWKSFYRNVSTLPVSSRSVFVRPLINTGPDGYSASPLFRPGFHWDTLLFPIADLVEAFSSGMIQSYFDVIQARN